MLVAWLAKLSFAGRFSVDAIVQAAEILSLKRIQTADE
jgi:hypothetical protein